ncbi:MAG TPA: hypothetical protein VFC78_22060 [Tepidisphaeraceae bacterium]|nr:hypothetical protein [Tepidisphaeraceae bacterium]
MSVKFASQSDFDRMARATRAYEAAPRDNRARPNPANSIFQANFLIPIQAKVDGGVAGSLASSTNCSWTYSLFDLTGTALLDSGGSAITGQTPAVTRYHECAYDRPADYSAACAWRDTSGVLHLYHVAQEKPTGAQVTVITTVGFSAGGSWFYKNTPMLVLDSGTESAETDYVTGAGCL